MTIHLNTGGPKLYVKRTKHCPDCKQEATFAGFEQIWYGLTEVCCNCGREFMDGEWMRLPFEPKARERNIADATRWLAEAVPLGGPEWSTWLTEQLEQYRESPHHDLTSAILVKS